eukprot:TRINITY_DN72_c0_g1_i4.p1 TRINITY_DN72_c0_g1~~TRINITY_DN72_c0_g1_i4.p1  ORF type:complete len:378 (-),score=100.67 TRINITY_DN72_c0_g1_i4:331-1464(-)
MGEKELNKDVAYQGCAGANVTNVTWVLFLLLAGLAVVGVGIGFLAKAKHDSRAPQLALYQAAIDDWNDFAKANFSDWRVGIYVNSTYNIPLNVDNSADSLNDNKDDIPTYTPLKYTAVTTALQPWTISLGAYDQQTITIVWGRGNDTLFPPQTVPITLKVCIPDPTALNAAVSVNTKVIYQMCAKVNLTYPGDDNFQFSFDGTNGGYGCTPVSADDYLDWPAESYVERFYHSGDTVTFSNVAFTIRSSYDPYIAAQEITKGTLQFNSSPADITSVGRILIILGIIWIICIVIIAIRLKSRGGFKKKVPKLEDGKTLQEMNQPPAPSVQAVNLYAANPATGTDTAPTYLASPNTQNAPNNANPDPYAPPQDYYPPPQV